MAGLGLGFGLGSHGKVSATSDWMKVFELFMGQSFHLTALELFTELKEAQMLGADGQKQMELTLATVGSDEPVEPVEPVGSGLGRAGVPCSPVECVPALGDLVRSLDRCKDEAACASHKVHKLQEENWGLRCDLAKCVRADVPFSVGSALVDFDIPPNTLKLTEKLVLDILVHRYLVATGHKDVAALLQEQWDVEQVRGETGAEPSRPPAALPSFAHGWRRRQLMRLWRPERKLHRARLG
jgi:hypothetical protein